MLLLVLLLLLLLVLVLVLALMLALVLVARRAAHRQLVRVPIHRKLDHKFWDLGPIWDGAHKDLGPILLLLLHLLALVAAGAGAELLQCLAPRRFCFFHHGVVASARRRSQAR
eukprot:SAG31_NODE_18686_length_626_cov_1.865275_1_plen_113_part_00